MRLNPGSVIVSQSALILAIVLGWLFMAGHSYVSTYLDLMRIGVAQRSVPAELMIVYGWNVAVSEIYLLAVIILTLAVQVYFMWRMDMGATRALALIALLVVIAFFSAQRLGERSASARFQTNVFNILVGPEKYKSLPERGTPYFVKVEFRGADGAHTHWAKNTRDHLESGCAIGVWLDDLAAYVFKPSEHLPWYYSSNDAGQIWRWRSEKTDHGTIVPFETIRVPHDEVLTIQISDRKIAPCPG